MDLNVIDLGLIEYQQAWSLQEKYALEIADGKRAATLLLVEHPHVYTFGRKGHIQNLLWGESQLKEKGLSVYWVDRGGDVTYHGPGQLVGYPLIPLGRVGDRNHIPQADYVGYLRKLEKTLIVALTYIGVAAGQLPGLTGVWVQADAYSRCPRCRPEDRNKPAKLAAIGVKVDARGVARHGFALNVNPDMSYWDGIVACGLAGYPVVSLAELLNDPPGMSKVKEQIELALKEVFGFHMVLEGTPQDN